MQPKSLLVKCLLIRFIVVFMSFKKAQFKHFYKGTHYIYLKGATVLLRGLDNKTKSYAHMQYAYTHSVLPHVAQAVLVKSVKQEKNVCIFSDHSLHHKWSLKKFILGYPVDQIMLTKK